MSPLEVLRRDGAVSDADFDGLYPEWVQDLSEMFWTPVEVAIRAAHLLVTEPGTPVLDVGSGVGKFCLVAASVTPGHYVGVEQRQDLVEIAQGLASELPETESRGRAHFEHGDMQDMSWRDFQGVYLFNPFFELTSGPWCQIDDSLKHSVAKQAEYIDTVVGKLATLSVGARVATYFGFGGELPDSFRKICYEQYDRGPLEVWVKE